MKIVYIAHPLGQGADREGNRANAAHWVAWAADQGVAPIADWVILSGVWSEDRREEGLAIDKALIEVCDEVWLVGGRISPGMAAEKAHAGVCGITVRDYTHLGSRPPMGASRDDVPTPKCAGDT